MKEGFTNYVGPDLEWNENDPPMIYPCNPTEPNKHAKDCSESSCIGRPMTELEVELVNEMKKWQRERRPILGVPECLANEFQGFVVSIFDLQLLCVAMKEALDESGMHDTINTKFQRLKLNKLREARKILETREIANMNHKPILGPDGRRIA